MKKDDMEYEIYQGTRTEKQLMECYIEMLKAGWEANRLPSDYLEPTQLLVDIILYLEQERNSLMYPEGNKLYREALKAKARSSFDDKPMSVVEALRKKTNGNGKKS